MVHGETVDLQHPHSISSCDHIPQLWRQLKILPLRKQGKDNYCVSKAYQLISQLEGRSATRDSSSFST